VTVGLDVETLLVGVPASHELSYPRYAGGAKTRAAVANPASAIFSIFISTSQNGLAVVSLPMNMPCPVLSLVKRMPSPLATTVQPWMW
jgi:hypothetical protein